MTSTEDAILSTGNINIDGAGSVNATSAGFDAIDAEGDLAIKGSGNVNATGVSDGIRANGNITIDDSGAVTARATKDKGIGTDKNLTIKGGGTVEASSADGEAIWSGGNINISDGSQVKASSEKDAAVEAKGSLAATNASLNANGVEYGVYAHKGITLDHANVTVRASKGRYGDAIALFTYQDDIVVKNGSTVDAFAEGEVSAAFSTRNDRPNEEGGHIYISDSVVKAIARYVENGDGPIPYSENQDGETSPEPQGENIGIIAQTSEGVTPAVISIIRSKVTAEGDTAAIFARAMSADGKTIGTIKIENAAIQTPEGGKVIDYRKLRDGIYEAGQAIGTGDAVIDSPYNEAVAKSMVIAPPEVAKPEDPKPDETKPAESKPAESKQSPSLRLKADQGRCGFNHESQDYRRARGNRRHLECGHRGNRPCGNSRYRRRHHGEPQALLGASAHMAAPAKAPSPSTVGQRHRRAPLRRWRFPYASAGYARDCLWSSPTCMSRRATMGAVDITTPREARHGSASKADNCSCTACRKRTSHLSSRGHGRRHGGL